jgi:hypothetical protein
MKVRTVQPVRAALEYDEIRYCGCNEIGDFRQSTSQILLLVFPTYLIYPERSKCLTGVVAVHTRMSSKPLF